VRKIRRLNGELVICWVSYNNLFFFLPNIVIQKLVRFSTIPISPYSCIAKKLVVYFLAYVCFDHLLGIVLVKEVLIKMSPNGHIYQSMRVYYIYHDTRVCFYSKITKPRLKTKPNKDFAEQNMDSLL